MLLKTSKVCSKIVIISTLQVAVIFNVLNLVATSIITAFISNFEVIVN